MDCTVGTSQPIAVEFPIVIPFKDPQCSAPGRKRIPLSNCEQKVEQINNGAGILKAVLFSIVWMNSFVI